MSGKEEGDEDDLKIHVGDEEDSKKKKAPSTKPGGGGGAGANIQERIAEAGPNQLIIIRFTKYDCNKCAATCHFYEEMVEEQIGIIFLDADMQDNLAAIGEMNITEVPTFVAFKDHKEVGRYTGTDPERVEALIKAHN